MAVQLCSAAMQMQMQYCKLLNVNLTILAKLLCYILAMSRDLSVSS